MILEDGTTFISTYIFLLHELRIWTRFFSYLLPTSIVRSLLRWSFRCGSTFAIWFSFDGWPCKIFAFLYLIRYNSKCYLIFLYIMHGISLVKNLHTCMGSMDATKLGVLIIIKRGRQYKVGRERFTPYHVEDLSSFELFCLYLNVWNGEHKNLLHFLYTELYLRKIFDQTIHRVS